MNKLKEKISLLPSHPGVYQFYDRKENLIYIGKAKNLKKRVQSYFNKKNTTDLKTKKLVNQIIDVRYTVVETERDALILENNLIKQFQPKYNVLLKDGKSYPYICITNERFPRIVSNRNKSLKGKYYGPYSSVKTVNTIVELLHKLYPLRTCKYLLSEENIRNKKFKACLEYQLGNCNAPCIGMEELDQYMGYIEQCKNILEGKMQYAKQLLSQEMAFLSENYEFEKAEVVKNKLESLQNYQNRSTIVSNTIKSCDVISIIEHNDLFALNHLKVQHGIITSTKTIRVSNQHTPEETLESYLFRINPQFEQLTVVTNVRLNERFLPKEIIIEYPKIGDKKKLLELSIKNCFTHIKEISALSVKNKRKATGLGILETAKKDLNLKELPSHIECFDNSNFQGSSPVASMVCFKNSLPSKKDYRHFNIKTVEGPDDFGSMKEIIYRRYKRLLDEKAPLPQLIVIDGGKGQLSSAYESIKKLGLEGKIAIISIAKKLEEIYYPGDSIPLYLDKKSTTLQLIQRLRNEAHRFAIQFHRKKKQSSSLELEQIPGLGKQSIDKLLKQYKSINKASKAPIEELSKIIGTRRAEILKNYKGD